MTLKRLVLAAFSAVLLSSGIASAATCVLTDVSGATMCEEGSTSNDTLNPVLQVNVDEIFGYDDWVYIDKDDSPDGEYELSGSYDMYMLVLKGANEYNYHAYLLDGSDGTYGLNPDAFEGQATSHATLYGRTGVVPLPAAGFMLLAGLGSLALVRRRR